MFDITENELGLKSVSRSGELLDVVFEGVIVPTSLVFLSFKNGQELLTFDLRGAAPAPNAMPEIGGMTKRINEAKYDYALRREKLPNTICLSAADYVLAEAEHLICLETLRSSPFEIIMGMRVVVRAGELRCAHQEIDIQQG